MNKAAPWNVRGVGRDSREAAREAARRAGMSLGEWLDSVIAEEASALGVDAEDINADDRLEAVTAKLSRLTGAPAAQRKPARAAARPRIRPARDEHVDDDDISGRHYGYGDAGPVAPRRAAMSTAPAAADPEALLDAAVARMELHSTTAQRQTHAALENVASRLEDIESHITARRDDTSMQPIQTAIGRLEERMESLSRRPAPPRADPRVEASLRDLTSRLDEVAHMIDRSAAVKAKAPGDDRIHQLDAKLSSIMSQLSDNESRRASVAAAEERARRAEAEQRAIAAEADKRARQTEADLRAKVAEADKRARQVETELRAKAAEAEKQLIASEADKRARQTEADLRAKAAEADRRARQVETELRAKAAEAEKQLLTAEAERQADHTRRAAQPTRALAHLPFGEAVNDIARRQRDLDRAPLRGRAPSTDPAFEQKLESIATRMEKAADAASGAGRSSDEAFGALHGEISRLARRLDDMRSDAQRPPAVHPEVAALKRDIGEMSRALADLAPRGSVAALETAVRDLATRIELSRQDGARDTLLAPVEALVSDLQATLKDFDPRRTVSELDREIKNIGRKVDTMTVTGFDPEAFKRIHSQSQEIRDLLTAAAARPLPVDKIEKQIAALGGRIDFLAQAQTKTPQPDMSSAIGEIRTMFDRAMVSRAAPSANIDVLEKRLESLALKIDQAVARPAPPQPAAPDISGLERMMARFAERVETARQTNQDPRALEALQKQVAQINSKLDASDVNHKTLGAIEASISDLFQGFERTRVAAVGAAEHAVRAAAAEAAQQAAEASLRHVVKSLPQGASDAAETQAIKRDLVGMRAEQDATGRRATAALNAVHVTLEKVVDRLASMEGRRSDVAIASATLEETRQAAAEAARAATRDALNDALSKLPKPAAPVVADTAALERGFDELRAEQDAAGKRAHAAMSAVHGTLEKVVDRLASMESRHNDAANAFSMLDEARQVASDAARAAAREAMSEAMANLPAPAPSGPDTIALERGLVELRADQEEAGQRAHATMSAVHGTLEKVVDRLATLEDALPQAGLARLEETRELAIEAARTAARETLREAMTPASEAAIGAERIKADVADLRTMHEEAGERTHSTLKAVHATLEKVVDRLSTLENTRAAEATPIISTSAPPFVRERASESLAMDSPDDSRGAPVFVPAPRRFDIAVDPQTLRPKPVPRTIEAGVAAINAAVALQAVASAAQPAAAAASAATTSYVPTIDGFDMLLEPGSGFPLHRGAAPTAPKRPVVYASVRDEIMATGLASATAEAGGSPASFIAAARRAAQAAAADTAVAAAVAAARPSARASAAAASADAARQKQVIAAAATGKLAMAKSFVSARKKPILIGMTGLMLVLGASMLVRNFLQSSLPAQHVELTDGEAVAAAEPAPPPERIAAIEAPPVAATIPPQQPPQTTLPIIPFAAPAGATLTQGAARGPTHTIPGDVASNSPSAVKGRPLSAPSPAASVDPTLGRAVAAARAVGPAETDPLPVGAIDAKTSGAGADPTLSGIAAPLRVAAVAGNAGAQYEMGLRFAEGRTVPRDLKTAALWLEKSASQGLAPAQYRLGSLYEKGLGVARDIAQAKSWYTRAADGGNTRAMHNLAVLTAEGVGSGKPDYPGAAQWFKKAAEYGVRDSQYNLAILYARGLGIEQNLSQSYTWFALAAAQGDEDAGKKRDEIAGKLDSKALAVAKTAVDTFRPAQSLAISNDVSPPTGGWEGAAQKTETGKTISKI